MNCEPFHIGLVPFIKGKVINFFVARLDPSMYQMTYYVKKSQLKIENRHYYVFGFKIIFPLFNKVISFIPILREEMCII